MSTATINGRTVGYDAAGGGPAIVLIHGFPFNRSMWSGQIEALSDAYRVIAPDLPGFGGSDRVGDVATMEEMAAAVAALLDHLSVRRAIIGGLSMGGYVTLAFYRKFELMVSGLVLADTRAGADSEQARANREVMASRALSEGMGGIADEMLGRLLSPATVASKPEVVAGLRRMMASANPAGVAAALRGMAARTDQTEALDRIIPPSLVIAGSDDQVTPVAEAELMHGGIAGSHLEIIQGAGHVSNLEQPEAFNRALRAFADSLQP